jgi:hypothetical protein
MPLEDVPFAKIVATPHRSSARLGLLSLAAGLIANLIPAYFILSMLRIPAGSSIRPMIESASIFSGALIGLGSVVLAVRCIIKGRDQWLNWTLGLVGGLVGLMPWVLGNALFRWVIAKQGFTLEP